MTGNKPIYKQVNFYMASCTFVAATLALILYAANCASVFNANIVSPQVVAGHVIAVVLSAIAIAASVAETFLSGKPVLLDILKYKRFFLYGAFLALLYSSLMSILAEYSLIGTILYKIFRTATGDPVSNLLLGSYFTQLACAFVGCALALTAALLQKSDYNKAEKTDSEPAEARA